MTLRPATDNDEALFFMWRQWAEKRGRDGGWYLGADTDRQTHKLWFADRAETIRLMVWCRGDYEAGVVRIDSNGEVTAYCATDLMPLLLRELQPFAFDYGGRLKVTVDVGDDEITSALEQASFREYNVRFFAYRP